MNKHCECPLAAGYCRRHRLNKTLREVELCKGLASTSPSRGKTYWIAWETGNLGATAPEAPVLNPEGFGYSASPYVSQGSSIDIPVDGPGNELHRIIQEAGYEVTPGCSCLSMLRRMNLWGSEGCRQNRQLIAEHMYQEFRLRRPVLSLVVPSALALDKARSWVDEAIEAWEKRRVSLIKMKWAYGVTTVPSRYSDLLPRTLKSLAEAGFPAPRLFVDDNRPIPDSLAEYQVTYRSPKVRVFGNWVLSAWELLLRNPEADRFAIFQDDFVTYKNLRKYLEACPYPEKGYWNLYTFPHNAKKEVNGWHLSDQFGRGAVALVFSNLALRTLLAQRHMVDRPLDCHRGWRAVDGGIVTALKKEGWEEFVHTPSLVQHTGLLSSMGNSQHLLADTFRGEDFDAMELLCEQKQIAEKSPS